MQIEYRPVQNHGVTYDVGILGGGIIGWACADALSRLSPSLRVAVFEKRASFGLGATNLAAGGVRAQFGTEINIELSKFSIDAFLKMPSDIAFRQYGYLFLASNEKSAAYLELVGELQRQCGVKVETLSKQLIEKFAPYLNASDLITGNYSSQDGYLDPYAVCAFFEKSARRRGVTALYNFTGALPECKTLILATGQWSKEVGREIGIEIPIVAEKHQLAIASPASQLPIRLPMVVDLISSFHFRREGDGILIGFNDYESKGDTFDYGFLERLAEPGINRLPILSELGFDTKKCWAGFYAETPDHHAIIDRIGNVIICTGFGGHGVMHSPAAGLAAAELALLGRSKTFDLRALRLSRFNEGNLTQEQMVI